MKPWQQFTSWLISIETCAIGLIFLFAPKSATSGAAYAEMKKLLTIPAWGVVFLLVAAAIAIAIEVSQFVGHLPMAFTVSAALHAFLGFLFLIASSEASGRGLVGGVEWIAVAALVFIAGQVEART